MKGIVFDIKRFAVHDGPGIRTTVFLKGCPLSCWWCHNPESIDPKMVCVAKTVTLDGKSYTEDECVGHEMAVEELMQELRKEQVFMQESGGGVTFSGGEPLLQHRFLQETLKVCRAEGMHTTVDTTAFSNWNILSEIVPFTDLFLIDLKLMNETLHQQYTGVPNALIHQNIGRLLTEGRKLRIRIPMIPGISATDENIRESIAFLNSFQQKPEGIDLLPFHQTASHKYKRFGLENRMGETPKMVREELADFVCQFENAGLNVTIGG